MRLLRAVVILCFFKYFECTLTINSAEPNSLLSSAVVKLVNEFNSAILDIIIPTNDEYINKFVSNVVTHYEWPVIIEHKIKHMEDRKRLHILMFVEDHDDFLKIYEQMTVTNFYFNGIYLVVYPEGEQNELNIMFEMFWKKSIFNVNIITQKSELIEMFTFMPFKALDKCSDTRNIKINEFDEKSMEWKSKNLFPLKFKDLHNCQIKCGVFKLIPAIIVNYRSDGTPDLHGFDVDIFNELLDSIGAVVNYTVYPVSTGSIFKNGSGSGLLGHTIRGDVDASLRSYSLQLDRRVVLSETNSYFSDKLIMIMPPPMPLNPLMKFIRPLRMEVWAALGLIVIIATIVITLTNFVPKKYYRMIIGDDMRDEFLNLLNGFIGSSQNTLPEKNFPRFLLMMFLLFCLVIRSLYLGALFGMLKTEIRSREFTSIRDFFEAEFNFYMYETLSERLNYSEINARRKIIDLSAVDDYAIKTLDPEFKGVVFQYVTSALYTNQQNFKNFTYKICRETLMTNHLVFYFRKSHFLVDEVNEKIGLFISSGITNYFISKYAEEKFRKVDIESGGPSKLTLHHFIGMYQLWMFGLSISFILFIGEVFYERIRSSRKKLLIK